MFYVEVIKALPNFSMNQCMSHKSDFVWRICYNRFHNVKVFLVHASIDLVGHCFLWYFFTTVILTFPRIRLFVER